MIMFLDTKTVKETFETVFENRKDLFTQGVCEEAIQIQQGPARANIEIYASLLKEFWDTLGDFCDIQVRPTYFDYGAGMMWTQIIAKVDIDDDGYQVLDPRDMESVISGDLRKIKEIFRKNLKTMIDFKKTNCEIRLSQLNTMSSL